MLIECLESARRISQRRLEIEQIAIVRCRQIHQQDNDDPHDHGNDAKCLGHIPTVKA